jgi:ribonuclease D
MITETTTPPPPGDQHDRSSSDHRVPEAAPVTLVPLIEPSGGVPHVVETERELARAAKAIAAGEGPVASTPNARPATATASAPTWSRCVARARAPGSIDPIACPDLSPDRRGDRGRVDPARRHPGPACLRRGRAATRCSSSTPSWPRGYPRACLASGWLRGRALPRAVAGQGALRRRLVEAAAARAVAALCRPRRRGARRTAQPHGRRPAAQGKAEWARQEFAALLSWAPPSGSTRGGERRGCTRASRRSRGHRPRAVVRP